MEIPFKNLKIVDFWKSLSVLRLTTPEFEGTPGTITPEKPSERVGKDRTVNKLKGERTGVV